MRLVALPPLACFSSRFLCPASACAVPILLRLCIAIIIHSLTNSISSAPLPRFSRPRSRVFPGGMSAFWDFAAARDRGVGSVAAVTAPLTAGDLLSGFLTVHFKQTPSKEESQSLVPGAAKGGGDDGGTGWVLARFATRAVRRVVASPPWAHQPADAEGEAAEASAERRSLLEDVCEARLHPCFPSLFALPPWLFCVWLLRGLWSYSAPLRSQEEMR